MVWAISSPIQPNVTNSCLLLVHWGATPTLKRGDWLERRPKPPDGKPFPWRSTQCAPGSVRLVIKVLLLPTLSHTTS